jgi:hypothetical protein
MADYHDQMLTPRPDTHGITSHPIDSTDLVNPYGDQHGTCAYPIDSSGDVHPQADNHDGVMPLHPGVAKPGSFK